MYLIENKKEYYELYFRFITSNMKINLSVLTKEEIKKAEEESEIKNDIVIYNYWEAIKYDVVKNGIRNQLLQNKKLLEKLMQTDLNNIVFNDCKLLGLHFDSCSEFLFTVTFNNCQLDLSSFFKRKMKNTRFQHSSLREVDFSEADLTGAIFDKCDLSGALFDHTNIEKADFRTAFNYSIDPEINQIKKAKFSATGIAGLLTKYNIEIH